MARNLMFALLVLAAVIAAPVTAQDGKKYTLEGKDGGWEVEELLKMLAALPDCTVQYDPNTPYIARKKIEVVGKVELERGEFFDWMRGLLSQQRIILVPVGPLSAHTWSAEDLNSSQVTSHPIHVPEEELEKWAHRDGAFIVTTVCMKHLRETSRLRNALAQLSTRLVGRVNDVPGAGTMVIADFAPVAVALYRMVKQADEDASKLPQDVINASDPRIRNYETKLAECQTETAANYFVERIQALTPKPE